MTKRGKETATACSRRTRRWPLDGRCRRSPPDVARHPRRSCWPRRRRPPPTRRGTRTRGWRRNTASPKAASPRPPRGASRRRGPPPRGRRVPAPLLPSPLRRRRPRRGRCRSLSRRSSASSRRGLPPRKVGYTRSSSTATACKRGSTAVALPCARARGSTGRQSSRRWRSPSPACRTRSSMGRWSRWMKAARRISRPCRPRWRMVPPTGSSSSPSTFSSLMGES